ncbi:hypothetical protein [Halomontanus rarus]|uniref:hypothetical protein n=1 Tax=Halomontanus rarus TaxID=3034020 RepID=UPI0023E7B5B9|nr:hypothetical protein [Halovivax sp. TS33]
MRPTGEHRRTFHVHTMSTDRPHSVLELHRTYRYLLLIEVILTIVVLTLTIAARMGLL